MKRYRIIEFPQHGDSRGELVVIEQLKEVAFDIKRIFYMYGTNKEVIRGKHANRKSRFVLIALQGSCKVMVDDGKTKEVIKLDQPSKGIYLQEMVWKEMYDFSEDTVLLVLSSELYDKMEYVVDYKQFLEEVYETH